MTDMGNGGSLVHPLRAGPAAAGRRCTTAGSQLVEQPCGSLGSGAAGPDATDGTEP